MALWKMRDAALRVALATFVIGIGQSEALSADATEESGDTPNWVRLPASTTAVSGNKQVRKRYPGGADEDDLQVQATLPNPNRGLEAHEAVSTPTDASSASD